MIKRKIIGYEFDIEKTFITRILQFKEIKGFKTKEEAKKCWEEVNEEDMVYIQRKLNILKKRLKIEYNNNEYQKWNKDKVLKRKPFKNYIIDEFKQELHLKYSHKSKIKREE